MVLRTSDAPIVAGAAPTRGNKRRSIVARRSFMYQGAPVKAGDVLEVEAHFAAELITSNKAADAPAAATKPADPEVRVPAPSSSAGPLPDAARPMHTRQPRGR